MLDLESGDDRRGSASQHLYGPTRGRNLLHSWSPDSKWLAYTLRTDAYIEQLYLYSVADKKSRPVTDGMSEVSEPMFDAGGKYLYFFASTDAGPVKQWFSMSNADMVVTRSLYLAVLARGVESPLKPESDEEGAAAAAEDDERRRRDAGRRHRRRRQRRAQLDRRRRSEGLRCCRQERRPRQEEGRERARRSREARGGRRQGRLRGPRPAHRRRCRSSPVPYSNLVAGTEGKIFYLRSAAPQGGPGSLRSYDLAKREEKTLIDGGIAGFSLSGDRTKVLYAGADTWAIAKVARADRSQQGQAARSISSK